MSTVVGEVVEAGNCCGCGVCAGVCPSAALGMAWNAEGDLVCVAGEGCTDCGLCLRVCPFAGPSSRLDDLARARFSRAAGMAHHPDAGFHLGRYVGHAAAGTLRERGASGGVVTWLLEALLQAGEVDAVVAVVEAGGASDRLFEYRVLRGAEAVREAAGSRYYPVDLAQAVREVLSTPPGTRCAVVALPCRAYALRLAMARLPALAERVRYMVGLTCGQLQNGYYTEYLAARGGIAPRELGRVGYREKAGTERAGNFRFVATSADGARQVAVPYHPLPYRLGRLGYFGCSACYFCDDVFAEAADAVAMDAWLPAYEPDPRGTSLLVTREPGLEAFVAERAAAGGGCALAPVSIDEVVRSQASLIERRLRRLPGRLWRAAQRGQQVPPRRVEPDRRNYLAQRRRVELVARIVAESKRAWATARVTGDVEGFGRAMAGLERAVERAERLEWLAALGPRIARRLLKALGAAPGGAAAGTKGGQ